MPPRATPAAAVPLPHVSRETLEGLPPVLRAVVRALGLWRAQEWLRDHGGVNVVIRKTFGAGLDLTASELVRIRWTLAPHMDADGRVWLPKADKLLIHARDAQIRRERAGSSINKLARNYRLSSRQIVNICREEAPGAQSDPQLDLFA